MSLSTDMSKRLNMVRIAQYLYSMLVYLPHNRGRISAHDITVGYGCRLLFTTTGTSSLLGDDLETSLAIANNTLAGHYRFDSLTVADGGEVTMTEEIPTANRSFILTVGTLHIQGGGHVHEVEMTINADHVVVDDLGLLVGDTHDLSCGTDDGDGLESSGSSGSSGRLLLLVEYFWAPFQ